MRISDKDLQDFSDKSITENHLKTLTNQEKKVLETAYKYILENKRELLDIDITKNDFDILKGKLTAETPSSKKSLIITKLFKGVKNAILNRRSSSKLMNMYNLANRQMSTRKELDTRLTNCFELLSKAKKNAPNKELSNIIFIFEGRFNRLREASLKAKRENNLTKLDSMISQLDDFLEEINTALNK